MPGKTYGSGTWDTSTLSGAIGYVRERMVVDRGDREDRERDEAKLRARAEVGEHREQILEDE